MQDGSLQEEGWLWEDPGPHAAHAEGCRCAARPPIKCTTVSEPSACASVEMQLHRPWRSAAVSLHPPCSAMITLDPADLQACETRCWPHPAARASALRRTTSMSGTSGGTRSWSAGCCPSTSGAPSGGCACRRTSPGREPCTACAGMPCLQPAVVCSHGAIACSSRPATLVGQTSATARAMPQR